jgi:hypothetical protein
VTKARAVAAASPVFLAGMISLLTLTRAAGVRPLRGRGPRAAYLLSAAGGRRSKRYEARSESVGQ